MYTASITRVSAVGAQICKQNWQTCLSRLEITLCAKLRQILAKHEPTGDFSAHQMQATGFDTSLVRLRSGRDTKELDGMIDRGHVPERGRRDGLPGSVGGVAVHSTED